MDLFSELSFGMLGVPYRKVATKQAARLVCGDIIIKYLMCLLGFFYDITTNYLGSSYCYVYYINREWLRGGGQIFHELRSRLSQVGPLSHLRNCYIIQ